MVNLKSRIENLKKETGTMAVKELCEKAIAKIEDINEMHASLTAKTEIENGIVESFLSELKDLARKDAETQKFLEREERFFYVNNLGVKTALNKIAESDLAGHPALKYAVNTFQRKTNLPEYIIAEEFVAAMHPFEWHPAVKENLAIIRENANKNREDFIIHKAIYNLKNSRSSYILSGINESIEDYLINRTKASKAKLVEKLNKFIFDPMVRELSNVIRESEAKGLTVTGNQAAKANKVYSPVIVTENSEIFGIGEDFYEKVENVVRRLSEAEINNIDPEIIELTKFIASKGVSITSEGITIYSNTKKVQLVKENDTLNISINGKNVNRADFNKIFSNAGVFRPNELKVMEAINRIIENFDSIVEVDFAKRIESNLVENRRIDIIRLGESIFITQNDPSMGKKNFFKNLNATQTKTLVNEFLSYDISESFTDMIPSEEAEIKAIEETKKAYIQTISQLEEKLFDLNKIKDKSIVESLEFKSIVQVIEEEINSLKSEYNEYVAAIHNKTQVTTANEEEMVNNNVEPTDKFNVDDRVVCPDDCEGTVTGLEDAGNRVMILCDDGSTKVYKPEELKKIENSNESEIEIKVDGKKIELETGKDDDDEDDDEDEDNDKKAKSKDDEDDEDDKVVTVDEDHAAAGDSPETSTKAFTPDDRVENKEGEYGTVTGVDDTTGKVTVLMDNGTSCACEPEDLVIVKEKGVDENKIQEGEGAGDKVKLQDGRNATVQGKNEADDTLTVVTDDGETLVVKASDIEIIDDLSGEEEEEKVKGQQDKGTSVSVEE